MRSPPPPARSPLLLALLLGLTSGCNLFTQLEPPSDGAELPDLVAEMLDADMVADAAPDAQRTPDLGEDMVADLAADMPEDMPADMSSTSAQRLVQVAARTHLNRLAYDEYMPATPPGPGAAPLIIWLHDEQASGAGGLERLDEQALIQAIRQGRWSDQEPSIILAPRLPDGRCLDAFYLADFIGFALNHYPALDVSRIHLVGVGCGASAAWGYLASDYDSPVTSALLIGGDGQPAWASAGCQLRQRASIWALDGAASSSASANAQLHADLDACAEAGQQALRAQVRDALTSAQVADALVQGSWPQAPEPDLLTWLDAQVSAAARPARGFTMSLPISRRALVDLGIGGALTSQRGWNNLTSCQQSGAAISLQDDAEGVLFGQLRVSARFNGTNGQGTTEASAPYPASAASDGCYVGDATLQVAQMQRGELVVSGLEPSAMYDVTIYGSRIDAMSSIRRQGRYVVNGVEGVLEVTGNVTAQLLLQGVPADSAGQLKVELRPEPDSLYAYIGVLEVLAR